MLVSMTEQNSLMILFIAGCLLITWTFLKWKVPNVIGDYKWFRLCSRILGIYSIIIAVISKFFKVEFPIILLIIHFIFLLLLNIGVFIIKVKKAKKGILRNMQLGINLLIILWSFILICLNMNEIASSIVGVSVAIVLLAAPFEEI